jgi:hypothetical protein
MTNNIISHVNILLWASEGMTIHSSFPKPSTQRLVLAWLLRRSGGAEDGYGRLTSCPARSALEMEEGGSLTSGPGDTVTAARDQTV